MQPISHLNFSVHIDIYNVLLAATVNLSFPSNVQSIPNKQCEYQSLSRFVLLEKN